MKLLTSLSWLALIMLLALTSNANGLALPEISLAATATRPAATATKLAATAVNSKDFIFGVGGAYGDGDKFNVKVSEAGCILAQITFWSRLGTSGVAAGQLAVIINGSDRTGYYGRVDGKVSDVSPLWVSYAITSTEVSRVQSWTVSVLNFTKTGTARGTLNLKYPPTQMPCELKVAPSRTRGQIDLSWIYTGKPFRGSFLVERSSDGRKWSVVSPCRKLPPTNSAASTSYSCSDTGLKSSTTYYYRGCAITSGSKCETTDVTPAISVKTP
jgi:hypothetical protein